MSFVLTEMSGPGLDVLEALKLHIERPLLLFICVSIFLFDSAPESHLGTWTERALPVLDT